MFDENNGKLGAGKRFVWGGDGRGYTKGSLFQLMGTPRVTTEILSHATVFIPNKLQTNLYLIQTRIYNLLS